MVADLTNTVALDKAVRVQSVNGPSVTRIVGRYEVPTRRCAWLTNGATLSGFTLRWGGTHNSGDVVTLMSGGGAWCSGTTAVVTNCYIMNCIGVIQGGGAYGGTLKNCWLWGNRAGTSGGGAYGSVLNNCTLNNNDISGTDGGATRSCVLTNCTLSYNFSDNFFGTAGSSADQLYNCIVYSNSNENGQKNYDSSSTFRYCCSTPLPLGAGNIGTSPLFQWDGTRLMSISPCLGKGSAAYVSGLDIDGQAWGNPPAMGSDEWHPEPAILAPAFAGVGSRVGEAAISVNLIGQLPLTCWWTKDGVPIEDGAHYSGSHSNTFLLRMFSLADAGTYQIVASNSFGMVTSQVAQVSVHCVDAAGSAPSPPYAAWGTAATNIQDAVDAAYPGDVVLVTNGIYANGGAVEIGTNIASRVAVGYQVTVFSVNGPDVTVIEGQWDPIATNGPGSVRCVFNGGALSGFTLRNGSTYTSGFLGNGDGGGIYNDGVVAFCTISNNVSAHNGGGAYCVGGGIVSGVLNNCVIVSNSALQFGGGASASAGFGALNNCLISGNRAGSQGGGCSTIKINNCTVTLNSSPAPAGVYSCTLTNCIVYFNSNPSSAAQANYSSSTMQYCCTTPLPGGVGNLSDDPQLVDGSHISGVSPCRGAGSLAGSRGTDIDGEAWASPPSIGCDEVRDADLIGPLSVSLNGWPSVAAGGVWPGTAKVTGRAASLHWAFGDDSALTNASYFTQHTWTNPGDYTVTFTAFNSDNAGGVSTNLLVHVVPLVRPTISAGGLVTSSFSLSFPGQPGVFYAVEQATNLAAPVTWQTVATASGTGTLQVVDSKATNAMHFYRVRIQ